MNLKAALHPLRLMRWYHRAAVAKKNAPTDPCSRAMWQIFEHQCCFIGRWIIAVMEWFV